MSKRPFPETFSDEHKDKVCNEFVEITKTDQNLAIYYLSSCNYNLQIALENYEADDHIVIDGYTISLSQITIKDFRVISWNLDGLDEVDFKKRINAAILTIVKSKAMVILLQELVAESEAVIRHYFKHDDYELLISNEFESRYYSGILIKRHPHIRVVTDSFKITNFTNSRMYRNLLSVTITVNKMPVKIMTAHLESTREFSDARKQQLKIAFEEMSKDSEFNIFAGDLNLRDSELVEVGGLPAHMVDLWESTGKRNSACNTWDPQRNTNASSKCPKARGMRFDRMYFYSNRVSSPQNITPVHFGLDGMERLSQSHLYPSDHWAIIGHFQVN